MNQSYVKTELPAKLIKPLYLLLFIFFGSVISGFAQQTVPEFDRNNLMKAPDMGDICKLPPTDINRNYFKKAEERYRKANDETRSANFEITYVNSRSDGTEWPAQAQNAFEYAMGIWETYLQSEIPIRIEASWIEREGNVLGSAGPTLIAEASNGEENTWYTVAQASAMSGVDQLVDNNFAEEHDIN